MNEGLIIIDKNGLFTYINQSASEIFEHSFEEFKSINSASVNKWQDILSRDEIEIIEFYCKTEMEVLKYKPTCKQFDQQKIEGYTENKTEIAAWLSNFDFKKFLTQEY